MTYRKPQTRRRKRIHYNNYVKKIQEQDSHQKELLRINRLNFLSVLYEIYNTKCDESWNGVLKILNNMKKELKSLGPVPDKYQSVKVIRYCVKLFDIVSKYQDILEDMPISVEPSKYDAIKKLNIHIYLAGRHEPDEIRPHEYLKNLTFWNVTKKNEPVTVYNIYFGPDLSLPPRPASYWLSVSKKEKFTLSDGDKKKSMWVTDALVQSSIHCFCRNASQDILEDLDIILS